MLAFKFNLCRYDEAERQNATRRAGLEAVRALLGLKKDGDPNAPTFNSTVGVGAGSRQGVVSGQVMISDIDQIALKLMVGLCTS